MEKLNDILDCVWSNGCYYMLKCRGDIEVYDDKLNYLKSINTDRDYNSIAYNDKEQKFYFYSPNDKELLYESSDLKKFSSHKLNLRGNCFDKIKGLSYCDYGKSIIITTTKKIFMFDLCKKHLKEIYEAKEKGIKVNDCTGPLGCNTDLKINLLSSVCCCKEIYIAYRKDGISYISKLNDDRLDNIIYETHYLIKSMFIVNDEIYILITDGCEQKIICTGINCYCDCDKPGDCKCEIIESIALIEKSIAKILNSESLKIKSSIDKSKNIKDLICVNSSVKEMIYYVTILEFVLTEKLRVVSDKNDCD